VNESHPTAFEPALSAPQTVKRFVLTVLEILLSPRIFFRRLPLTGRWVHSLVGAIIVQWASAVLGFFSGTSAPWFTEGMRFLPEGTNERFQFWFAGVGSVLLSPVQTLLSLVMSAFVAQIGLSLLVRRTSFETTLTILAYASVANVFKPIPWVGEGTSFVWGLLLLVIAFREVFRISTIRAFVIAIFPLLLSMLMLVMGLMLLVLTVVAIVALFT
jgi:hypothetical protein